MIEVYLFYLAFAAQILVMSVLLPFRYLKRIQSSLDAHPPATHPELYPEAVQSVLSSMRIYRWHSRIVTCIGFVLLCYFVSYMQQPEWAQGKVAAAATAYFALQCTAFIVVAWGLGKFNCLLKAYRLNKTRTAELQRRTLFDFVSPAVVILTALCYPLFLALVFYINQNPFPDFHPLATIIGVTFIYATCIISVLVTLHRKKSNPLQSHAEQRLEIGVVSRICVYSLLAAMVFILGSMILALYNLKTFVPAFQSIFFACSAWLYVNGTKAKVNRPEHGQYKPDTLAQ